MTLFCRTGPGRSIRRGLIASLCFSLCLNALPAMGQAGAAPAGRAGGGADTTLENAQRLLRRAMAAANDGPIGRSPEAGQIVTALRSTQDKDLLPIFEKLRQGKDPDNQVYGMIAAAILMKDPARVDLSLLFAAKDSAMIGSAIASLVDANVLTTDQLKRIMNEAPDAAHQVIGAAELFRRKELPDRTRLLQLVKDEKELVRYYAATTLLGSPEASEVTMAQQVLKDLTSKHNLREAPVQALMLLRVQKDKLLPALPWAVQIASDPQLDEGLRYTAVAVVLSFKGEDGPRILADMINQQKETIQQVKLGLVAYEFGAQLKPALLEPLVSARSTLARNIGTMARQASEGADSTAALLALIKEGHPIVLDWALAYSDRSDADRQVAIRTALVNQATIVDNIRDRDYERAAYAAQKLLDENGQAGWNTVKSLLAGDNRAVIEASLAGIYRSKVEKQSDLVLPIWNKLITSTSTDMAANYAALILAREKKTEALVWLPGMIIGGTVQGQGFRALAGWYYAQLKGQTPELLRYALTD